MRGRLKPGSISLKCSCFLFAIMLLVPATVCAQESMHDINPRMPSAMEIDQRRVLANGLRVLTGQHITLYTDLPESKVVDELPTLFDAAVPQWCEYFGVDLATTKAWKLSAFLIRDKSRFEKAGLIPDDLYEFPAGVNRGHEIWLFKQPDDYYTRHLLLHEGTHAFMQWFVKGLGAPWYAEGMAEVLGLHRWENESLSIHHRVQNSTESEGWGRPKILKNWVMANSDGKRDKTLRDILQTPARAFADVENYAWCWAACEFLERHPASGAKFHQLQQHVSLSPEKFNEKFLALFGNEMTVLERDWAWFVRELDYGYSSSRSSISELIASGNNTYLLKTDRSWQLLDMPVKAGQKFRVSASGRFEVGSSKVNGIKKPWPCEAGGITIDYFRGRPLGELQMMVLPSDSEAGLPVLCRHDPTPVGVGKVVTVSTNGRLCFRVNESPSELGDNRGELEIAIEKIE